MHKNTLKKPKFQLHPNTLIKEIIKIEDDCLSFFLFSYAAIPTRLLEFLISICRTKQTQYIYRGVARNFYMGGPIRTMKVEIDDDEYHRCMDSLYF